MAVYAYGAGEFDVALDVLRTTAKLVGGFAIEEEDPPTGDSLGEEE
jgi:hypothetical protein